METVAEYAAHGGVQQVFSHASEATGTAMTFAVFLPPQARAGRCPVLWYLSGLTCTHANVMEKGEYRRDAAERGVIVVCPDTSPRGKDVADDPAYDLGQGAGFYVDAVREPWSRHFRMESYIARELPGLVNQQFPADMRRQGIFGHSMGGHGALTLALKKADHYRSCSAFAPIVAPARVPWGEKAFGAYLGDDRAAWRQHDAVALIEDGARLPELLVDQGEADSFLQQQLRPELLSEACEAADIKLTLRMQAGYDHSYYFVSTFMPDHINWHADRLLA
ncbi:MAG: S-formylglutathione hydrolase [Rhizobiales bacterium]|nr:S-formylglutathione hydrolase [Hyphomicrobiales bacterium]